MPAPAAQITCSVLLLAACGFAQSYANVYGRILDQSEGGIGQAAVTVVNENSGFRRVTESDATGGYAVNSLEPGSYKITVRKDGFRSMMRFGVVLPAGNTTRADFLLPVGSVFETITVRGTAPLLNESSASTGASFGRAEIERLPLNGGGLLDLLQLVAGANVVPATRGEAGQFTATGQRPNTNYFTIDGVSANNGLTAGALPAQASGGTLPSVTAFGSMDSLISLNAVDEFQVQTSTFAAAFGRMPGANLAVTSQAGSNQFHGTTLYRTRNELTSANDWFLNRAGLGTPPLRLNEVSQTFGGPVQRDKTFFFLSYQRIDLREPFVQTQPVPSADARAAAGAWAQPALSLFPLPNQEQLANGIGQWTGGAEQPGSLNAGSIRIDRAIGVNANFFARYNDAPSANRFGVVEMNQLSLRSRTLTLGLTAHPWNGLLLDTRVNESETSADSAWADGSVQNASICALREVALAFPSYPASCDTLVRFTVEGVGQLTAGLEGERRQRQTQVVQTAQFRRDSHSLEAGADFRRITAARRDAAASVGIIANSVTDLYDTRDLWHSTALPVNQTATVDEYSLWAQDIWQATRHLTIAAGIRWELSPAPVPAGTVLFYDPTTGDVPAQHRALWRTSYHDFAPRLGLAWRLTKDGRTVLRAGAGIYYESSFSIASDILTGGPLDATKFQSGAHAPFGFQLQFGFNPDLKLPVVRQWNVTLERALTAQDVFSLGYVGSYGRELVRREVGGPGSTPSDWYGLVTNNGVSNYQALQFQYRRRLARNLQASASYTWSHSIDDDSSDAFLLWAGAGSPAWNDRGSSDFDLRHSFQTSLSYGFSRGPLKGWRVDGIFRARTGFPITVLESQQYSGIAFMNAFRPNLAYGQPLWIANPSAPGGRSLNPAAFEPAASGVQGNLGRNAISGFGMWQLDAAVGREIQLRDRLGLELQVEAFNALNHANFGDPVRYLDNPLFGNSTSMLNVMLGTGSPGSGLAPVFESGGPRGLQGSLKFRF